MVGTVRAWVTCRSARARQLSTEKRAIGARAAPAASATT